MERITSISNKIYTQPMPVLHTDLIIYCVRAISNPDSLLMTNTWLQIELIDKIGLAIQVNVI